MIVTRKSFYYIPKEQEVLPTTEDNKVFLIDKKPFLSKIKKGIPKYILSSLESTLEDDVLLHLKNLCIFPWFWQVIVSIKTISERSRIIVSPSKKKKAFQQELNKRIGNIRSHPAVFGFVRGRSAYDCAAAHTTHHGGKFGLLVKMDISNFFNSVSDKMIESSLAHHGFNKEEIKDVVENCTMDISGDSPSATAIIEELVKTVCDHTTKVKEVPVYRIIAQAMMKCTEDLTEFNLEKNKKISSKIFSKILYTNASTATYNKKFIEDYIVVIKKVVEDALKCGPQTGAGNKMLYQGGPSSPFLSNICFKILDYRIDAYAKACGGFYTRYADDMCFSFKERRTTKEINLFVHGIKKIVSSGGFIVNSKKTKVSGLGGSQKIVGYCVNSGKPTIPKKYRKEVDKQIKALARHDPISKMKLVSKVDGMISYVSTANADSAKKLKIKMENALYKQSTRHITI